MPALLIVLALAAAAPAEPPPAATLRWFGHSCFLITTPRGALILIDPYSSDEWPGLKLPYVHADLVLITHAHWDHSAWRLVKGDPKVRRETGEAAFQDARVLGIAGRHAPIGAESIRHRNIIFVVETGGVRLCHLGDNGPPSDPAGPGADALKGAIGAVDILLLPVDAERRVLTYEAAREWVDLLRPRIVIPMHYRIPGVSLERIQGIGTVDEWLSTQQRVRRLPGDTLQLGREGLPSAEASQVLVLTLPGQRAPEPGVAAPGMAAAAEALSAAQLAAAGGDLASALEQYTRAAQLDPADPVAPMQMGWIYMGQSRPDRAAESFEKAVAGAGQADRESASMAWLGLGMARDLLGRRDAALEAYKQVIALGLNAETQMDQARRYLETPYTE